MASGSDQDLTGESSELNSMISKPLFEFTSKIFKPFASKENVVLSPISIHKGLSMVLLGADNGTQTKDELLETLGLKNFKEDEINKCLEEYSALIAKFKKITKESQNFYQESAKHQNDDLDSGRKPPILDIFNMVITKDQGETLPAYEKKVKRYFDSTILSVDDKRPETKSDLLNRLNSWGKEAGFSQPIMQKKDLDERFAALLLSAIGVQAFWFSDFHEYEEKQRPIFYNHGKNDQPAKGFILSQSDPTRSRYLELTPKDAAQYKFLDEKLSTSSFAKLFEELRSLNVQVVEIPLEGGLSFTIFEPRNRSGQGGELDLLVNQLMQTNKDSPSTKLEKVFSLLDSKLGRNHIEAISFPKFGFENEIDLKAHLQSIGLRRAFNRMTAQISNMTTKQLFIEKVTHQAMIDVNKFGIKAAGVTKIKMVLLSAKLSSNPIEVRIENPFLFFIRYAGLPLFVGRLDSLDK